MPSLSSLRISFLAGTLGQGGAERQLYYIIKVLKKKAHVFSFFCLSQGEFWEEPIRSLGVPVIWVGGIKNRFVRLVRIYQEIKKFKPHYFQSQHFFANIYVALPSRLLGIKNIGAIRNNGEQDYLSVGVLERLACLYAPAMLAANSQSAIDYLSKTKRISLEKLFFLPNVINLQKFPHTDLNKNNLDNNGIHFVSVGRLVRQKRFDRMLRLMQRVQSDMTDIRIQLNIIGEGPHRKELETLVETLSLSQIVTFHGERADVDEFYKNADIFILTSEWEGTPNVILEAMASGLAVVSTNVGGISEIIQSGETGLLVDYENETDLFFAVKLLINDVRLRSTMGAKARLYIEQNHAIEILKDYLQELYEGN